MRKKSLFTPNQWLSLRVQDDTLSSDTDITAVFLESKLHWHLTANFMAEAKIF